HQHSAALVGGGLPAEKKPFAAMQRVFCYMGFEKKTSQDNQHLEKQSIHYKTINTSRGKLAPTTISTKCSTGFTRRAVGSIKQKEQKYPTCAHLNELRAS
ncbi:hypothetical protein, partial [Pseudoalteromonas peptidolytica]|uniref:hypothetical protein n=1 Tax=Pseudoalteromonas peptidolytica TaxID=61150 RepID=UPI00298DDECA